MEDNSCRLPDPDCPESDALRLLVRARRVVVVGLSDDPARASHRVARYLLDAGKEVVPVNPTHERVLGLKCYARLEDVPGRVDLVNVFRRASFCAGITEEAIRIHAGGVWLQSGIVSPEAERLAADAGMPFVQDRCLMVEHAYLTQANLG
jgi:predicted CoA-binding protein